MAIQSTIGGRDIPRLDIKTANPYGTAVGRSVARPARRWNPSDHIGESDRILKTSPRKLFSQRTFVVTREF